jgi:hypothetical protein
MLEIELNGAPHACRRRHPASLVDALALSGQALALAVNRAWCRASSGRSVLQPRTGRRGARHRRRLNGVGPGSDP